MSRTLTLIAFLFILSIGLVFVALQPKNSVKKAAPKLPMTKTILSPTPAADTSLSLSPNQVFLATGSASLSVDIHTGTNLISGVQLEVAYDPTVITNVHVQPGTFFPSPVVILNEIDQKSGRISYALGISPSQNSLQGDGQVATITFSKNPQAPSSIQQTEITLLEKSLATMLGAQHSVLKHVLGATVNLE